MQQLTILGATGSIGASTLDVVARHPDRFRVYALSGNSRIAELAEQCRHFKPCYAVVADARAAAQLGERFQHWGLKTDVLWGMEGLCQVASAKAVDVVMAAIVGAAGLLPTLAAARAGKKVLLANKESLVMGGQLFIDTVEKSGAILLPIDSEHNAIFQCLPKGYGPSEKCGVKKILLTASGGPFRSVPLTDLAAVTPDQACAHPNWQMGRKISVDSATMMNKGLELIEACWLFGLSPDAIDVVIHPQSIIHSMVEYVDGSVLAQLGNPDMRTPIAHALAWPERIESGVASLDIVATARLDFGAPDSKRFPCLGLAIQAAKEGGSAPAVLNAANEVAVEGFLKGQLSFIDIAGIVAGTLEAHEVAELESLEHVQQIDKKAREDASVLIRSML